MEDLEKAYLIALEQAERAIKAHPDWKVTVSKKGSEIIFKISTRKKKSPT